MSSNKSLDALKSNDLFKGTDLSTLDFSFDSKNLLEFKEGDIIYSSGMPSEFIYLLIKGEVKIKVNSIKRLFFKSPNEFFGESEVLRNLSRESSAIANSDCTLYKIDESLVKTLVNNSSAIRSILLFDEAVESLENRSINQEKQIDQIVKEEVLQLEPEKVDVNNYSESGASEQSIDFGSQEFSNSLPEPENTFLEDQYSYSDTPTDISQVDESSSEADKWLEEDQTFDNLYTEATNQNYDEPVSSAPVAETDNQVINNSNFLQDLTTETKLDSSKELARLAEFLMQDVKAPLLTVKHYSSILSRFNLPAEVQKVISLVSYQSNSVLDLLQASIDYSENNIKPKFEEVNINETLTDYLTNLSDYVESRNVKLFKKLGEDSKAEIDKRKLYVAFYYISRFACDLMKQGGNLYFSTELQGSTSVISVKDENKILSEVNIQNVFNPDFPDENTKSGLSMAISKFLIESMHGSLSLQTSETGTVYKVSIPVSLL